MTQRIIDAAVHAFPRRFRASRGEEMRATLAEVLAADPRRFALLVAVVDLVRAGWALRWRTRPTLGRYLRFRVFETPLPVEDHPWLFDYVQGWFRYRQPALVMVVVGAVQVAMSVIQGSFVPTGLAPTLGVFAVMVVIVANVPYFARRDRDRIMRRHGYVRTEHPGT